MRPRKNRGKDACCRSATAGCCADGTRARHQVSEGDRVLFGSYAGTEVVVNGEELLIMSEDEILAIVP